jgi:hypothetical protein
MATAEGRVIFPNLEFGIDDNLLPFSLPSRDFTPRPPVARLAPQGIFGAGKKRQRQ